MKLANQPAEFTAGPIGHCVAGRSFLAWCAAPDLSGIILWGAPDEHDARTLVDALEFAFHPDVAPTRAVLVDCRAVERAEGDTLLRFASLARDRMGRWSTRIRREVVLLPYGLAGILLAGAIGSLGPAHPLSFARELGQALELVDHVDAPAASAAATSIANTVRGQSGLVERFRHHLSTDLVNPSVDECAKAMGLSARTLQRELRRCGTSFSDELCRMRVTAAETLLELSDLKVEVIAHRVGFGSASRMSCVLRRELSATPSMVRAGVRRSRQRAAEPDAARLGAQPGSDHEAI